MNEESWQDEPAPKPLRAPDGWGHTPLDAEFIKRAREHGATQIIDGRTFTFKADYLPDRSLWTKALLAVREDGNIVGYITLHDYVRSGAISEEKFGRVNPFGYDSIEDALWNIINS
jgi:hypothetical protein